MSQITARLPDDIVRQAIELYLEDYADLSAAVAALKLCGNSMPLPDVVYRNEAIASPTTPGPALD